MRKELAILGCLMLVAAAVPIAVAHNDTNRPGPDGTAPSQNQNGNEVFGRYVGTSGVYVNTVNPVGRVGTMTMTCDAEALGEPTVDGSANPSAITPIPDSTFDDGGQGGACHTVGYANSNWNTPGCSDFNGNGVNDHVGGQDLAVSSGSPNNDHDTNVADTFVVAACDSETRNEMGFATCIGNAVLANQPSKIINQCPSRLDPGTPNPGLFLACGSDGSGDYATVGYVDNDPSKAKGNGRNTFPAPTSGPNCNPGVSALALFVLAGADTANSKVSVATTGWVGTMNK